ncbi:MAG TPA: polysaccharide deacetylase family protein, partial [Rhizomicrobium sp.]
RSPASHTRGLCRDGGRHSAFDLFAQSSARRPSEEAQVRKILIIAALSLGCGLLPAQAQEIAFTFDDLPAHSTLPPSESRMDIANSVIATWKAENMPPVFGFVNGIRIEQEPLSAPVLPAWRAAGFPLGNHTWSHMNLNTNSLRDFENDLLKNENLLARLMPGKDWRWLRFPYLAEGNTPEKSANMRAFLARHHYKIAAVTMSFSDYLWNEPYARCSAKGDTAAIAGMESSYLQSAMDSIGFYRAMSKVLYGRDIPYVLLMHIGAFDAHMLPRLIALYRAQGFKFVTLQQAESDPFYRNDLNPKLPGNPDTLEAAMQAKNLALPAHHSYDAEMAALCR